MYTKLFLLAAVFGVIAVDAFYLFDPFYIPYVPPLDPLPPLRPTRLPPVPLAPLPPLRPTRLPSVPTVRRGTTAAPPRQTTEPREPEPPAEPVRIDYSVCFQEECNSNDQFADWKCAEFCYENKCTFVRPTPWYRQGSCSDRRCDCF